MIKFEDVSNQVSTAVSVSRPHRHARKMRGYAV